MPRRKIALVGGGQIGGILALICSQKELGDIAIIDIPEVEGMVKGKALDLMQLRPHDGYDVDITGTSNWKDVKDLKVCMAKINNRAITREKGKMSRKVG